MKKYLLKKNKKIRFLIFGIKKGIDIEKRMHFSFVGSLSNSFDYENLFIRLQIF